MVINDAHCHFFSHGFFQTLASQKGIESQDSVDEVTSLLDWESPGTPQELASRWVEELDRNEVSRAALIASVPKDEESVAAAVAKYPDRFVGFFILDPRSEEASQRVKWAIQEAGLRCMCLFPAMHHHHVYEETVMKVFEVVASLERAVAFVHCGVLSIGVRKRLGLPSNFATRLSNPIDLQSVAMTYPQLPIIIPHFGAGFFREALMVADLCPNIYLDTSSSNSWTKYYSMLKLEDVFRQALEVVGCERLLFGTDSSFFPRGWQRAVWESQVAALDQLRVDDSAREKILGGNFDRLFPPD